MFSCYVTELATSSEMKSHLDSIWTRIIPQMVKQMQPGERSLADDTLKKACPYVLFEHLRKMESGSELKTEYFESMFVGHFGARVLSWRPRKCPPRDPSKKLSGPLMFEKLAPARTGTRFSKVGEPNVFLEGPRVGISRGAKAK